MTSSNPYSPPTAEVADLEPTTFEYVGFWRRVLAALIDSILILAITTPLAFAIFGSSYFSDEAPAAKLGLLGHGLDILLTYVFPAVASIAFWLARQATPGKMVVQARVVDARTGGPLTPGQAIGRYAGYYVSLLPLGLGILWVAFDARKQGWHDKLARTVVVRAGRAAPAHFEGRSTP